MLQSMGSQRVGHDLATEKQHKIYKKHKIYKRHKIYNIRSIRSFVIPVKEEMNPSLLIVEAVLFTYNQYLPNAAVD